MLAVDTNIFLELFLKQEKHEECKAFLALIRDGKIEAMVSSFNVASLVLELIRERVSLSDIRRILMGLSSARGLRVYPTTLIDHIKAFELMVEHNLDFDDAVTLQCALSCRCDAMVTYDKHFKNTSLSRKTPADVLTG